MLASNARPQAQLLTTALCWSSGNNWMSALISAFPPTIALSLALLFFFHLSKGTPSTVEHEEISSLLSTTTCWKMETNMTVQLLKNLTQN